MSQVNSRLVWSLFFLSILSQQAEGQPIVGIGVQATIDAPIVTKLWRPGQLNEVELSLAQELSEQFQQRYRFWGFRPEEDQDFILALSVSWERNEGIVRVHLSTDLGTLGEPLTVVVYEPGQLRSLLLAESSPMELVRQVVSKVRADNVAGEALRALLNDHVPLATKGDWSHSPFCSLVLPLPWEPDYKELGASEFVMHAEKVSAMRERFGAVGNSRPGRYPVQAKDERERFDALQVLVEPRLGRDAIEEWQVRRVYLKRYIPIVNSRMKVANLPPF